YLLEDGSQKVCLVEVKTSEESGTQYLDMSTNRYVSVNENNCLVFEMAKRVWTEKMYLRPIPTNAMEVNTNLTQNSLWQ
ncbi:MAG: RagB/SusD family nutrient uptake outer membrane protein, partial [Bacteroidales bacterium]|nr:RagB/SusD family nutrient uptake outer membrane protein [Bacteroidales bacterium]